MSCVVVAAVAVVRQTTCVSTSVSTKLILLSEHDVMGVTLAQNILLRHRGNYMNLTCS
jgi:hypothetical protein